MTTTQSPRYCPVCRRCVLSWSRERGSQTICPLCSDPILSPTSPGPGQGDSDSLVDPLPTDLSIVAHLRNHNMLRSFHICGVCEENVSTSLCLQCDVTLCKTCAPRHNKLPALKNHVIEALDQLSPQRFAEIHRSTCKNHDDRPVEFFCSAHQELICFLCSTTSHRSCPGVKAIKDVSKEKRTELKLQTERLRAKAATHAKQVGLAAVGDVIAMAIWRRRRRKKKTDLNLARVLEVFSAHTKDQLTCSWTGLSCQPHGDILE